MILQWCVFFFLIYIFYRLDNIRGGSKFVSFFFNLSIIINLSARVYDFQVNKDVEIQVNSTESLQYISYQVLGRGDVIVASTVQIPNAGQHTAIIRFLATYAMAPTAHVIVQFVKEGGEMIADAVDIELDGVLQNYVGIF